MKKIHIILIIFALNTAGLIWWFSDTQVIKRQTKALTECITTSSSAPQTTKALKNQKFIALLAEDLHCSVQIKDYSYEFDRDDLAAAHLALLNYGESSTAEASDISLTFNSDDTATVTAYLNLAVTEKGGKSHSESSHAELIWKETEQNKWRIQKITLKGQ